MKYKQFIALKIKELREKKNLTKEQFAELLGCSLQTIYNYEKGKRMLKDDFLQKIIDVFELNADYFDIPIAEESVSKKYVEQIERELAYFKNIVISGGNFLRGNIKIGLFPFDREIANITPVI